MAIFGAKNGNFGSDKIKGPNLYPHDLIISKKNLANIPPTYKDRISILYLKKHVLDMTQEIG